MRTQIIIPQRNSTITKHGHTFRGRVNVITSLICLTTGIPTEQGWAYSGCFFSYKMQHDSMIKRTTVATEYSGLKNLAYNISAVFRPPRVGSSLGPTFHLIKPQIDAIEDMVQFANMHIRCKISNLFDTHPKNRARWIPIVKHRARAQGRLTGLKVSEPPPPGPHVSDGES